MPCRLNSDCAEDETDSAGRWFARAAVPGTAEIPGGLAAAGGARAWVVLGCAAVMTCGVLSLRQDVAAGEPLKAAVLQSSTVARLTGIDLDGRLHRLGEGDRIRASVVVFLSTECPISNGCLPELNKLATSCRKQGVECFGVISGTGVSRREAVTHSKDYHITFPVLFDASSSIRRVLQPTHTPQAFVLNAAGEVLYSGRVNDEFASIGRKKQRQTSHSYVREAVQASLRGSRVSIPRTSPVGCLMEEIRPVSSSAAVTFNRDIAPLVHAHCAGCHRPGQSAPFSLLTYEDVSRHARQIAEVTGDRLMPPWQPEPGFGEFRDDRRLTEAQIALIDRWVKNGKPRGRPEDLPEPMEFPDGWELGEPDLVLEIPHTFTIPASGPDIHQHIVLPTNLPKDRLVAALEFQPGNRRVVHHASFYLDTTGAARRLDASQPGPGYRGFAGPGFVAASMLRSWLPGMMARRLPDGLGRPLARGADLVIEIHYQCIGREEQDRSRVGLYFAPESSRQVATEIQVLNYDLAIPAGAARHHERATYKLPVATTLLDVAPHMHLLGREVKAEAHLPNGTTLPLIHVRRWDFNWQGQYVFREPIKLPKGTRLVCDFWFDNSAENPLNPSSPPVDVGWGDFTNDEMAICHFQCTCGNTRRMNLLQTDLGRYYLRRSAKYRRRLQVEAANLADQQAPR